MKRAALLLFALAAHAHAGDTLYKCTTSVGAEYRDRPCASGQETRVDVTNARMVYAPPPAPRVDPVPIQTTQRVEFVPSPAPPAQVVVIVQQPAAQQWPLWWPYVQPVRPYRLPPPSFVPAR